MGCDLTIAITGVESMRKNLDALFGNLGATNAPNQFFGLAGKHRSANQFDVTVHAVAFQNNVVHAAPSMQRVYAKRDRGSLCLLVHHLIFSWLGWLF